MLVSELIARMARWRRQARPRVSVSVFIGGTQWVMT